MRILVISRQPPWPLCHGNRLHGYELCRRLAQRHELLVVAECPGEEPPNGFAFECRTAGTRRWSVDPTEPPDDDTTLNRLDRFFGVDPRFTHELNETVAQWRPHIAVGMGYLSLAHLARLPDVPKLSDLGDDEALHRLLELRHGRLTGKWNDLKCLAATMLYQRRYIRRVDAVTVLSEADRRFCRWHTGHPRVECIPHGVDCQHYAPMPVPVDEDRVIFWGSLGFGPNVSAILYFAERVWPRILQRRPRMRWTIIGRGDSPALRHVRRHRGIDFVGEVNDIRPHVARAAVVVVPMISGAGIKNKIMEAWAMGKAVVCTRRALGSLTGEHGRNLWLARTPRALAAGVVRLAEDVECRRALGLAARQTAVQCCSWERAAQRLESLCLELVRPGAAASPSHTTPSGLLLAERC